MACKYAVCMRDGGDCSQVLRARASPMHVHIPRRRQHSRTCSGVEWQVNLNRGRRMAVESQRRPSQLLRPARTNIERDTRTKTSPLRQRQPTPTPTQTRPRPRPAGAPSTPTPTPTPTPALPPTARLASSHSPPRHGIGSISFARGARGLASFC